MNYEISSINSKNKKLNNFINKSELYLGYAQEASQETELLKKELGNYKYICENSINLFDYGKIIGIGNNKFGKVAVIEDKHEEDLTLYLSGARYRGTSGLPRLYASISSERIFIIDVFAIDENIGNGSILLFYIKRIADELKINNITGKLSWTDKEEFNKLEYFYKKNGFSVDINTERDQGFIKMIL